jgi:hypothetical protein
MPETAFTHTQVCLSVSALGQMIRLVRIMDRLSQSSSYLKLINQELPVSAQFDPRHASVMMGYDFHVTEEGPKLIEINTNAGGSHLACRAAFPDYVDNIRALPVKLISKVWKTFCLEYSAYRGRLHESPKRVVIIDEDPQGQALYGEMCRFVDLFNLMGAEASIADPSQLTANSDGVFLAGQRVDLIYNRHCDFYLNGEALSALRSAYLSRQVCLTPNPRMYGLLADKKRLGLWSDRKSLDVLPLNKSEVKLLFDTIPETHLLADLDKETVWGERKHWVFKPTTKYGSKGVLLGEKITHKRFDQLDPATTVVQRRALPAKVEIPGFGTMKSDFRLFCYRNQVLGVTARLYQGQVTNMQTPGGGFAPVKII